MIVKNSIFAFLFISVTILAQSADSTTKSSAAPMHQTIASSNTATEVFSLKKQQKVIKPTTTWSKLKDLFQ